MNGGRYKECYIPLCITWRVRTQIHDDCVPTFVCADEKIVNQVPTIFAAKRR